MSFGAIMVYFASCVSYYVSFQHFGRNLMQDFDFVFNSVLLDLDCVTNLAMLNDMKFCPLVFGFTIFLCPFRPYSLSYLPCCGLLWTRFIVSFCRNLVQPRNN